MSHTFEPVALPATKKAGVGLHFTSLNSPFGIGDIGDSALAFVDQLVLMGVSYWQFLPTGPTAYGDSPYQPLSAFAGNENLIGFEPLVRLGLLNVTELEGLKDLPVDRVDYGQLLPVKNQLLNLAARRFSEIAEPELKSAYEDFLERHDRHWLNDYAIYRLLKTRHDERPWMEWETVFARREQAALSRLQEEHGKEIENIKIIQFLYDRQWRTLREYANEKGVSLFGDMPIYIALDSADAWTHPEILLVDQDGRPTHVAGVPPDYFSADGQLWGNPLYDWKYHESDGFHWWIERLKYAASQLDLVRIDHFRGFESFWSVSFGEETAREGEWLTGPGDALFGALKVALGSLPLVAENLGLITPEVEDLRRRYGIPGMTVLQFAIADPDFRIENVEENCVCYTGTHDNDTTVGWFRGGGEDTRSEQEIMEIRWKSIQISGGSEQSIHLDMIRLAFNSRARLAIIPIQDFLGLDSSARLNTPGTTSNNWCWRVRKEQLSPEFCESVAKMIKETARS